MDKKLSRKNLMNSLVSVSQFNRGEAGKIFEEVSEYGPKIVLKNNNPACVLVAPDEYQAMLDAIEDYALYFEAEKRMSEAQGEYLTLDEVMERLNIKEDELENIEVDIE